MSYEQLGFYFRYTTVDEQTGRVKIVDVPQYSLMAETCFQRKNMCFNDALSFKFDGKKWVWFSKTALLNFIRTENIDCIKPGHFDNFIKMIRSACYIDALGIEQRDGIINVNNGVIDVATGELLPHSYKYFFKYCAPVNFNKGSSCSRWERFLLDVFENNIELVDLAQRIFGYILIGGKPFLHRAFVLYGSGRNGKSTFLDVLRAVIGSESYATVSLAKLDKEFSIVNLDGKLANIVEETPTDEINAEIFKNLVGGGEIQAAHKGFDEYKFRNNSRFVFACNEMPIFKDRSAGLEERLVFLPFNRFFKENERDTEITEKLLAELPGILNWAVEGAKMVLKDRKLPIYQTTQQAKEVYRLETDALYAWFIDEIEVCNSFETISTKEAYRKYKEDCSENGNRPYSKDKFFKRLRKLLEDKCAELKVDYDKNRRSPSGNERVFDCFKWKNQLTGTTPALSQVSHNKRYDFD